MRSGDGYHRISFRKEVQGSRCIAVTRAVWSPKDYILKTRYSGKLALHHSGVAVDTMWRD